MGDEEFLKPPPIGTWLLLALCALILAGDLIGPAGGILAPVAVIGCSAFALTVIMRWLGKVAGFVAGHTVTEFMVGYREARGTTVANTSDDTA